MKADPRISEIDAIARVKLVDGCTTPDEPDRYLVLACLTGYGIMTKFLTASTVLEIARDSSPEDVRTLACLEIAEILECAPTRVHVILWPEDTYWEQEN